MKLLILFALLIPWNCFDDSSNLNSSELNNSAGAATAISTATESAEQMRIAAEAFLNALDTKQESQASFEMDDVKTRTNWSNLPASMVERSGVRVGDLSNSQKVLFHDLIRASSSSQGYQKISGVMFLDDILSEQTAARIPESERRDFMQRLIDSWKTENYWISIFGKPQDANWAWLLSGHHLGVTFSVVGEKVGFTPLFLGAEPYLVEEGPYVGWKVLSHEVERGFEMISSLDSKQKETAVISSDVPRDVLEGPGRKGSLEKFEGLQASSLNKKQLGLLTNIIEEYVHNADKDVAAEQMDKIRKDGFEALYFSWMGPTSEFDARYYYRIHGPSILIEYAREKEVGGAEGAGNHIHTIVRDPSNDYGEDWLGQHYKEVPHER